MINHQVYSRWLLNRLRNVYSPPQRYGYLFNSIHFYLIRLITYAKNYDKCAPELYI